MKALAIQALRGSNFWSNNYPLLIQVRLEIEHVNPMVEAEAMANMAISLQKKAGIEVSYYQIKPTIYPKIVNVVFEYKTEKAGKQAAKFAIDLLNSKADDAKINEAISIIGALNESSLPNSNIQQLFTKAKEKNLPVLNADDEYQYQVGYGKNGILVEELNFNEEDILKNAGRIPIIAITGSNGKTTTTRLIAHMMKINGFATGFTTSDGIYIGEEMVDKGDTTGPMSAEIVLRNANVDIAVLETARGGIVRAGLGFDQCDIAVVTNIVGDHLGISDIETLEELAQVKAVIVNAVKANGFAVLNADNEFTIKIGNQAKCNVAWFSMNHDNNLIKEKIKEGGYVAFVEDGNLIFQHGEKKINVIATKNIPITFSGSVDFMTQNALAAALTAGIFGIQTEIIVASLKTFLPSAEQTPGRMNIFDVGDFKIMVDFAHNPDGFSGIRDFLKNINSPKKIGIIVGTGDRKEEDLIELGRLSAQMFDYIFIHQVKFLRGKTANELVQLLVKGILSENKNAQWERIPDEKEPLEYAMKIAITNSFIVALSDVLNDPIDLIKKYQNKV